MVANWGAACCARQPTFPESHRKPLDLKLTLTFSMREWDVANPNLEEGHESERAIRWNVQEECDRRRSAGDADSWDDRNGRAKIKQDGAGCKHGEADDNAEQVLLQHQSADAGRAGASQAAEREADGG